MDVGLFVPALGNVTTPPGYPEAGILLLAAVEQWAGIADRLAACIIEDPPTPEQVRHTLAEMIRNRALLIAAGYSHGKDCNALRAVTRRADSGCSRYRGGTAKLDRTRFERRHFHA